MSTPLTESEFSKHLNSKFQLEVGAQELQLELVKVKGYLPHENEQSGMERFSAFFHGPADTFLPQGVYHVQHIAMGTFDIFLVPVSNQQTGYQYEAVFNYFRTDDE